jgi:hypothetical protein
MAEHFGFYIQEQEEGQFEELVATVDPRFHKAIAIGLSFLSDWYGEGADQKVDEWFTAVYAVVMATEDAMDDKYSLFIDPTKLFK